jgi:hypothetical protein
MYGACGIPGDSPPKPPLETPRIWVSALSLPVLARAVCSYSKVILQLGTWGSPGSPKAQGLTWPLSQRKPAAIPAPQVFNPLPSSSIDSNIQLPTPLASRPCPCRPSVRRGSDPGTFLLLKGYEVSSHELPLIDARFHVFGSWSSIAAFLIWIRVRTD